MFDEAHTFTGALGAEAACLIRRLRAFCHADASHTTCIATSATIVDRQDPQAARHFAARFFGVPMETVTTVGEDYEAEVWSTPRSVPTAPKEDPAAILEQCVRAVEDDSTGQNVRSAYRSLAGSALPLADGGWPEALYTALSRNELLFLLNEALTAPQALADLPGVLQVSIGRTVTEAEILAWLTLGAAARCAGRPLLRPVVHGFVRGIGGAVVSFPEAVPGPRLWLAAEDEATLEDREKQSEPHAHFPVATCTTCGQHYFIAFLKNFRFTRKQPGGGEAGTGGSFSARDTRARSREAPAHSPVEGSWWEPLEETHGGKRVVLIDHLIGDEEGGDEAQPHTRTAPLHFCRHCGAAHPESVSRCRHCGRAGDSVRLHAVRQQAAHPGMLTSCLSCGSTARTAAGRYREPARPVTGTRQGRVVLVQLRDEVDPETGQRFTVKRYRSEKTTDENGWRHVEITLMPDNPAFEPITLTGDDEERVAVIAELLEVLGTADAIEGRESAQNT